MRYFDSILAVALMLCSCSGKETQTVYEKPQPNPTKVQLEAIDRTTQVSVSWKDNSDSELGYAIWLSQPKA